MLAGLVLNCFEIPKWHTVKFMVLKDQLFSAISKGTGHFYTYCRQITILAII